MRDVSTRIAEHKEWCAKWNIKGIDTIRETQCFIDDRVGEEFVCGQLDDSWGPENNRPPVPRVGEYVAATRYNDGSWLVLLFSHGDYGLSDTTPGSPASVSLFWCAPKN